MNAIQAAKEIACFDRTLADFVIHQANEIERLREALKPFLMEGFSLDDVRNRTDPGTLRNINAGRKALRYSSVSNTDTDTN